MGKKRTKIPRASFTVQLLGDDDFLELTEDRDGWAAFGMFVALVILAKELDSDTVTRIQQKKRLDLADSDIDFLKSRLNQVEIKTKSSPWLEFNQDEIKIRSFAKWNPGANPNNHGGSRPGAGRPRKSSGNQDFSRGAPPVSVTDSIEPYGSIKEKHTKENSSPSLSDRSMDASLRLWHDDTFWPVYRDGYGLYGYPGTVCETRDQSWRILLRQSLAVDDRDAVMRHVTDWVSASAEARAAGADYGAWCKIEKFWESERWRHPVRRVQSQRGGRSLDYDYEAEAKDPLAGLR